MYKKLNILFFSTKIKITFAGNRGLLKEPRFFVNLNIHLFESPIASPGTPKSKNFLNN